MKFRVWDSRRKTWIAHDPSNLIFPAVTNEGPILIRANLDDTAEIKDLTNCEIDRWTGLKDMHGREIYENDIVVWGHHCPECTENPIRVAVVRMNPDIQFYEVRMDKVFEYRCFGYRDTSHLEVVGNIRETPEALKNPFICIETHFKPLDRFLIFPESEKVKGRLLYGGKNFVAYGYGSPRSASPFYSKALPLKGELLRKVFKKVNRLYYRYMCMAENGREVEDEEKILAGELKEISVFVKYLGNITYRRPYFSLRGTEDIVKRYGMARFFLRTLDNVWREES